MSANAAADGRTAEVARIGTLSTGPADDKATGAERLVAAAVSSEMDDSSPNMLVPLLLTRSAGGAASAAESTEGLNRKPVLAGGGTRGLSRPSAAGGAVREAGEGSFGAALAE